MHHLDDDDLVLHYYGEPEAASGAAAHLETCDECRRRMAALQRVLGAVDAMPPPALPDGFERTVWARLEPALPKRRGWTSWLLMTPANLAWAATIVLLVAGAFLAGRLTRNADSTAQVATAQQIREGILLADLTEHLDRSQTMLVELVSAGQEAEAVDISLERDVAEDLVAANRLYRQTASAAGDLTVTALLEDLERLLVELAASPERLSAEDLERVKQRIAAQDLLFKVRVVSSAVREKQKQTIRVRAGQSS
ncbi:MAG TPA: hypothetical protein VM364_10905 [Vicinamibacterales bacterium]|nr:hypothetical protein [Vicinamibacterales bacterium]